MQHQFRQYQIPKMTNIIYKKASNDIYQYLINTKNYIYNLCTQKCIVNVKTLIFIFERISVSIITLTPKIRIKIHDISNVTILWVLISRISYTMKVLPRLHWQLWGYSPPPMLQQRFPLLHGNPSYWFESLVEDFKLMKTPEYDTICWSIRRAD